MTLTADEQSALSAFAHFAGSSPRRAKRYLNLYLLLKTSLQPGSVTAGEDRRVNERAIVALLAIVTALGPDDAFFRILPTVPDGGGLKALGALLDKSSQAAKGKSSSSRFEGARKAARTRGRTDERINAGKIIAALQALNADDKVDQGTKAIAALRAYAPVVRRYAF